MYNYIQKSNIQYLPQNVFYVKKKTHINVWTGIIVLLLLVSAVVSFI